MIVSILIIVIFLSLLISYDRDKKSFEVIAMSILFVVYTFSMIFLLQLYFVEGKNLILTSLAVLFYPVFISCFIREFENNITRENDKFSEFKEFIISTTVDNNFPASEVSERFNEMTVIMVRMNTMLNGKSLSYNRETEESTSTFKHEGTKVNVIMSETDFYGSRQLLTKFILGETK